MSRAVASSNLPKGVHIVLALLHFPNRPLRGKDSYTLNHKAPHTRHKTHTRLNYRTNTKISRKNNDQTPITQQFAVFLCTHFPLPKGTSHTQAKNTNQSMALLPHCILLKEYHYSTASSTTNKLLANQLPLRSGKGT